MANGESVHPPLPQPLPVSCYDNHTHLEFEYGKEVLPADEALAQAERVGIAGVVQVGTDLESSRWGARLAERDDRVLAAVALHPNEAPLLAARGLLDEHLRGIEQLASLPRVRAVGETGLDFFRTDETGRPAQFESFEAHIEIAKRHGLALQIHDRDAHAEVLETLLRVGAPERTVLHCFSGDVQFARECVSRGWFLSFSGTVTFKNAPVLREALAVCPPELLLVETDAPFLTPVPYRGRSNVPYAVVYTLRFIADELGVDLGRLCERVSANTRAVYGEW